MASRWWRSTLGHRARGLLTNLNVLHQTLPPEMTADVFSQLAASHLEVQLKTGTPKIAPATVENRAAHHVRLSDPVSERAVQRVVFAVRRTARKRRVHHHVHHWVRRRPRLATDLQSERRDLRPFALASRAFAAARMQHEIARDRGRARLLTESDLSHARGPSGAGPRPPGLRARRSRWPRGPDPRSRRRRPAMPTDRRECWTCSSVWSPRPRSSPL